MEAFAMFVVLVSFCAGVFGLINLVKPLGWLRIKRRWHAAALVGGSVFMFMVGGILGAASQPGGLTVAAAADPNTPAAATATAPAKKAAPAGLTQAEFVSVWSQVKTQMDPCDEQISRASEAVSAGDPYAAYPVIERAQEVCQENWLAIQDIEIPRSAKGEVRKALVDARDGCATALFVKQDAMEKVAKVADGETRPSAVAAARERMEDAGSMTMGCIVGFMSAAQASGLVLPEFEEAMASAKAG